MDMVKTVYNHASLTSACMLTIKIVTLRRFVVKRCRKMPIFSKKFDIKNIPQRGKRDGSCVQWQEKLDDFHVIQMNLSNKKKLKFVDGTWMVTQKPADTDDFTAMRKRLQKLEEENNLNQIKVDVLLDMLTENMAELKILRDK